MHRSRDLERFRKQLARSRRLVALDQHLGEENSAVDVEGGVLRGLELGRGTQILLRGQ